MKAVSVALLLIALAAQVDGAQEAGANLLAPGRSGLVPVLVPEKADLEAPVAEQLRGAEAVVQAALAAAETPDEELAEAYGMLGQLYHAYRLAVPAEASYRNARRLARVDLRWPYLLGYLHEQAGRLEAALELYEQTLQLRRSFAPATVRLANLFLQLDRLTEARAAFTDALALLPDSPAAHFGVAQVALSEGSYEEAVSHLQTALKLRPEATRLHYSLAMAYRGLGKLEQAQEHLGLSGKIGVRMADPIVDGLSGHLHGERVHLVRGGMAYRAGHYEDAETEFRAAVEALPTSVRARVNLASAIASQGNPELAMEEYARALELEPANATANFNLGVLLVEAESFERAIPHLEAAAAARPDDVEAQRTLARALTASGRREEALEPLGRAVRLDPSDEQGLLVLTEGLIGFGRHREAHELLDLGYALHPERGRTTHALARLLAASPDLTVRNGELALELAQKVFGARRTLDHGETVVLALAELGRCEEAAALQRELIPAAVELGAPEIADRLRGELRRYQAGPPCRPPAAP